MRLTVLMVTCLLLAGVVLLHLSHQMSDPFFVFMLKEFGMALLIAAFLTCTVEVVSSHQRKLIIGDVNKNVLYAVLSRNVPDLLFKELETVMLKSSFYRQKHSAVYTISPANGRVLLTSAHTYQIVNMSADAAEFDFRFSIDLDKKTPGETRITGVTINGKALSAKDLKRGITASKTHITFSKKVKIKKQGQADFKFEYVNVNEEEEDEIICSTIPTLDLELLVNTPEAGFKVNVETLHQAEAEPDPRHNGVNIHCWRMPRPLLPFQGIQFKWTKNPAPALPVSASPL